MGRFALSRVDRAPLAEGDLSNIWSYMADDSPAAADKLLDRLLAKLDMLAQYPAIGQAQPGLAQGLRSFTVGHYRLYYRPIDGGI